jgi:hypothetical protein
MDKNYEEIRRKVREEILSKAAPPRNTEIPGKWRFAKWIFWLVIGLSIAFLLLLLRHAK